METATFWFPRRNRSKKDLVINDTTDMLSFIHGFKVLVALSVASFGFLGWSSVAAAQTSLNPVDRMIESLVSTQTLTADFVQTTRAKSTAVRTSSGSFWLAKPGLLRWEVMKPYPQTQVLNTKEFWIYDPDLSQASVRPVAAANLTGLAGLLLSTNTLTREELSERYSFSEQPARDRLQWVKVVPVKPEPALSQLLVGIDVDGLLSRFEITDGLGQVTSISLTRVMKNISIDASRFQFTPPAGVSVLRAAR